MKVKNNNNSSNENVEMYYKMFKNILFKFKNIEDMIYQP